MTTTIKIDKDDILKTIYFIVALTQRQNSSSMQGALSSKGDQIGGIFDRWINTIPESLVFKKIILPEFGFSNKIDIVSDFYMYNPRIAGIAPDIIGIRLKNKIIPFAVFQEKWKAVEGMPQIEIKTFKKPQKMVNLRNQNYDNKYLVMVESELRIDYLLPFFEKSIFKDEIYSNLVMDDEAFILSNNEQNIQSINKVDATDNSIGSITLLKITTASAFMGASTFCESTVSVQYINDISEKKETRVNCLEEIPLSNYCDLTNIGLYRFNSNWYEGITDNNIPYYTKNSRGVSNKFLYRTVDLYIDNIDAIKIIKKSNSSIYIKTSAISQINNFKLNANSIYRIDFAVLDRSSNSGEEYFMQKSLVSYVPSYFENLKNDFRMIIQQHTED